MLRILRVWRVASILTLSFLALGLSSSAYADLNPTTAQRTAAKRLARVKRCYRHTLQVRPLAFGAIRVAFRVEPDGTVAERWISLSTAGDSDLETCILEVYDKVTFPTYTLDVAKGDAKRVVSISFLLVTDAIDTDVIDKNRELLTGKKQPKRPPTEGF